jgi:hypothetical protein
MFLKGVQKLPTNPKGSFSNLPKLWFESSFKNSFFLKNVLSRKKMWGGALGPFLPSGPAATLLPFFPS